MMTIKKNSLYTYVCGVDKKEEERSMIDLNSLLVLLMICVEFFKQSSNQIALHGWIVMHIHAIETNDARLPSCGTWLRGAIKVFDGNVGVVGGHTRRLSIAAR